MVTLCSHLELVVTNPAPSHTLPSMEQKVKLLKEQMSEGKRVRGRRGKSTEQPQEQVWWQTGTVFLMGVSAWRKSPGAGQRGASMS